MNQQLNSKTKNLREYLDSQLQRSQLAIKNLQTDMKEQEKSMSFRNDARDSFFRPFSNDFHQESFNRVPTFEKQQNQMLSSLNEDFKTKAVKKAL